MAKAKPSYKKKIDKKTSGKILAFLENISYKQRIEKIEEFLEDKVQECEEKEHEDDSDFRFWNDRKCVLQEVVDFLNAQT